ncbi:hypothetical protein REPUB_Repub08aG0117100 [Reevesia pubescens]
MPSFAFFSPSSVVEQESFTLYFSTNITWMERIHGDAGLDKLLISPDASPCCGPEEREMDTKADEFRRTGGSSGSRILAFHNKRSRTIDHGEQEQLDFMVSESVIRWASCTNLQTGTSLVC